MTDKLPRRLMKLLYRFESDKHRLAEQEYAQDLCEKEVLLAYVNENEAFTDGHHITVDPSMDNIFADTEALNDTSVFLGLETPLTDPWCALKTETRSQLVHECLHVIYTRFPDFAWTDRRSSTKLRSLVLHAISNIIEDAFIEGVGATVFPETEFYLRWGRVSRLFASNKSEGTIVRSFEKNGIRSDHQEDILTEVLEYMLTDLLYPFIKQPEPSADAADCIEAIRSHYLDGSLCPTPRERFAETCCIFDILEPIIDDFNEEMCSRITDILRQHLEPQSAGRDAEVSDGKTGVPARRLFSDLDGTPINFDASSEVGEIIKVSEAERDDESVNDVVKLISAESTKAAKLHTGITIKEVHPAPDMSMSKAYKNILRTHSLTISTYNTRFAQLLSAERRTIEKKQLFGKGISSSSLADPKKRWWYTEKYSEDIPDLAVLLLIDGSGSMDGEKRNAAVRACVILDSILTTQGIEHAIVEHRAVFEKPYVVHNVLVDFNSKPNDRLNILHLRADDGSREGLSLFWAARYLESHSFAENKLIIAVSDGIPCHYPTYLPPVSVRDTANAVKKIAASGTSITAIALDGCYDELRQIYPETIDCNDLNSLTGKLLRVINKSLGG